VAGGPAGAQEQRAQAGVPSFAELEAAGARIGDIRIVPEDMFDLTDPRENKALYRLANKLHINTRASVIERILLFKTGEPLSVRLIEETERLLRAKRYLYDVSIQPIAYRDGVADIEVRTRDTWSLDPGISVSRAGGKNTGRLSIEEDNLLGTGISVGAQYRSDVDRSGTQFHIADDNVLGTRGVVSYSYAKQDDGNSQSLSLARPFYALDTRWAAGTSVSSSDTIDPLYNAGNIVAEYGHRRSQTEVFGGWSPGLFRGWTRRYSLGFLYEDDDYELRPDRTPPVRLPSDLVITAPFVRFELIEDAFRKDTNLDQIGRIEDVRMGWTSTVQLGRALSALGSTRDMWVYKANVSNGYDVTKDSILLTNASFGGRYADGSENQSLGGSARYYHRHGRRLLYYTAVSGDIVRDPDVPGALLLGGDTGLRGYPLRYQAGERRALLTLEARAYSDWYPFRLFRVGGAVFYDVGRAWGGENQNTSNPGWLSDVGFGLRILNARTAFGHVLHADVAFPLNREAGIKSVQFLLRTKVAL
jgi:outer membrane protein assembly factor BamA